MYYEKNFDQARSAEPLTSNINLFVHLVSTSAPEEEPRTSSILPDFFCISSRFAEENIRERLKAELSMATTKIEYCRALYRLQYIGCIKIDQYASDAQRAIVFNRFQDKFTLSASDFCKARLTR